MTTKPHEELAEAIFKEIEHGDEEHRAWLKDALYKSPAIIAWCEDSKQTPQ